ncbi:MAG: DUF116 domain-containing protein [Candidatus Brocadiia bacterium]
MLQRILGLLFLALLALLLVLAGAALVLLAIYGRTGRVRWPRFSAFVGSLLYSPLCKLFRLFGKPTQILDLFLVDAANGVMAEAFARAGPRRIVVMPQCLRHGECQAPLHPLEGYRCQRCGRCVLGELSEAAEKCGFRLFIVPGDRFAKRLAKKLGADAAIGVACPAELSQAIVVGMRMGVASAGVPLRRNGCFETDVDVERVKDTMRRCGTSST